MTDFTFHTPTNATEPAKSLLNNIQEGYGFIPNLFAYMAEAPATLEAYLTLNALVAKTSLTAAQQQVTLLAVSVENECDFCTVAHRAMGKLNQSNAQTLSALNTGKKIDDASDAALAAFAQSITKNRGRPNDAEVQAFLDAGFTKQQIFEVILIVSIKTLSNYSNHLTNPEANPELLKMLED